MSERLNSSFAAVPDYGYPSFPSFLFWPLLQTLLPTFCDAVLLLLTCWLLLPLSTILRSEVDANMWRVPHLFFKDATGNR